MVAPDALVRCNHSAQDPLCGPLVTFFLASETFPRAVNHHVESRMIFERTLEEFRS